MKFKTGQSKTQNISKILFNLGSYEYIPSKPGEQNFFWYVFIIMQVMLTCPGLKKVLFYANSFGEALDPLHV